MAQRFVKGLTNNHLTWVMVDATDFATPESAASAATVITIYGKLRGATGVNTVGAAGTGSLTNDIQHVGASATGIYTIALAKADLSDASAAWYDQYIITLSCTGCARQTLVIDGGIVESQLLALSDAVSNAMSGIVALSDAVSNVLSALVVIDDFLDTEVGQINSRVLLTQSYASDAASAAIQANSRVLLNQSRISDIASYLVVMSGIQSDILSTVDSQFVVASNYFSYISNIVSGLGAGASASAIAAAVWSDYQSKVGQSPSQVYSYLSAAISDILSGTIALSDAVSNVYSAVVVVDDFLDTEVAQINSRLLLVKSDVSDALSSVRGTSDYLSKMSGTISDITSALTVIDSRVVVAQDIASDAHSAAVAISDQASNILSALVVIDDFLDTEVGQINSRVLALSDAVSNVYSAVVVVDDFLDTEIGQINSRVLLVESDTSNIYSLLNTAHAEPTGVPAANATLANKVGFIYEALRNKVTVTATKLTFFDDGGAAQWEKDLSDDGTTYEETEANSP